MAEASEGSRLGEQGFVELQCDADGIQFLFHGILGLHQQLPHAPGQQWTLHFDDSEGFLARGTETKWISEFFKGDIIKQGFQLYLKELDERKELSNDEVVVEYFYPKCQPLMHEDRTASFKMATVACFAAGCRVWAS
eukprot:6187078-Lingulodinium_polyedra.AAC.1